METTNNLNQFIDNELDPKEKALIIDQINNDTELQKQVFFLKEVNESIIEDDVYEYRKKLSLIIHPSPSKILLNRYLFFGIAAAVAILFSIVTFLQPRDIEDAFSEYYAPYQLDINTRSAEIKDNGIYFALKLYQAKEYEAAYNALTNYTNSNSNDSAGEYFLGICCIELKKYQQAESNLIDVINSKSLGYNLHAKWYLSMVYLKNKEKDKALPYLTELSNSNNLYSHDAKIILKKYY